jgi:hypothetical protein
MIEGRLVAVAREYDRDRSASLEGDGVVNVGKNWGCHSFGLVFLFLTLYFSQDDELDFFFFIRTNIQFLCILVSRMKKK